MLNFTVFFIAAVKLGGSAGNGYTVAGHFYLGDHGVYTEVSRSVFEYSTWHWRSLYFTHPLGALFTWLYFRAKASARVA